MSVLQNQQTSLLAFFSINGSEMTEGSRKYSSSEFQQVNDIETARGRIRRFYKPNKKIMNISYSYLPSSSDKTVDGKQGRDFIENLANNNPVVFVEYQDDPSGPARSFYGFITSYQETLLRRDLPEQCSYYTVDLVIEEK